MANANEETALPEKGRVTRVCRDWLVHTDHALAHNLQQKEFGTKYDFNRSERQTARTDVPLAKVVQSEEEERLQRERYEFLERQNALAARDAEIAERMEKLEKEKVQAVHLKEALDDSVVAHQYQQEELVRLEQDRVRREIKDQEYALELQQKERERYERKIRQKELSRERKRLERVQQEQAEHVLSGFKPEKTSPGGASGQISPRGTIDTTTVQQGMSDLSLASDNSRVLRTDGRIEDTGDFSDFYIQPNPAAPPHQQKELQELQDEELARLLQDQERKRGAQINKDALKTIEARDAEIAKVIQEQEKLKLKKRHQKHGGRHYSENQPPIGRLPPSDTQYGRTRSDPGENPPPIPIKSSPVMKYERENSINEYMNGSEGDNSYNSPSQYNGQGNGPPPSQYNGQGNGPPHYQGRGMGQSPYQQRPLPKTPMESMPDNVTVVPVATDERIPKASSPPPGYRPPPAYPNRRPDNDQNNSINTSPSSGNNVIAAIDPTYRERSDSPPLQHAPRVPAHVPTDEVNSIDRRQHAGTHGADGAYCDLDELGYVQGQRRTTLTRDGKRGSKKNNNCKQQ